MKKMRALIINNRQCLLMYHLKHLVSVINGMDPLHSTYGFKWANIGLIKLLYTEREGHMSTITIGLDIAKSVFHLVWMSATGKVLKRKMLPRKKVAEYFANIETSTVVMEACGSTHYWSRVIYSQNDRLQFVICCTQDLPCQIQIKLTD